LVRPWPTILTSHSTRQITPTNTYFWTIWMGLTIVSEAHELWSLKLNFVWLFKYMTAPLKKNNNDKLEVSHSIMRLIYGSCQSKDMLWFSMSFFSLRVGWIIFDSVQFLLKKNNQIKIKKKTKPVQTNRFFGQKMVLLGFSVWIGFGSIFFWFGSVFSVLGL